MKNKKAIKFIIIFALAFTLFFSFPQTTEAVIGTGIFDFFMAAAKGVKGVSDNILFMIILVFFVVMSGLLFFLTSASLLQWVVSNPQWLSLDNPVVESGLYFTTGIANLFIILVLVVIAFAWILKLESFAAKKALPRLIIVALLINFARVFIGIPIDFATILHRTILEAVEADIILLGVNALFGGTWETLAAIGGWVVGIAALFLIPFTKPFTALGFIIFTVSGIAFLPIFLSWLIQTILCFILGGVFLTLAFLFASRIFIIWFLTIFAPLAFLCWVLPQTQKHWNEWLHLLLSWIFFGLLVLFFLVIGLTGSQYLMPGGLPPTVPVIGWFSLPDYFGYYFFLFVFLSVTTWLAKRTSPPIADAVITQAKTWTGVVQKAGLKFLKEKPLKGVQEKTEDRWAKSKRMERWAKEKPDSMRGKFASRIIASSEQRKYDKLGKETKDAENLSPENFKLQLNQAREKNDSLKITALASAAQKKGDTRELTDNDIITAAKTLNKHGKKREAKEIATIGLGSLNEKDYENMGIEKKTGYDSIEQMLYKEAKNFDGCRENFWENMMEDVVLKSDPKQLAQLADKFGDSFVEALGKITKNIEPETLAKLNPRMALYLTGTPSQELGFMLSKHMDKKQMQQIIAGQKKEITYEEETVKYKDEKGQESEFTELKDVPGGKPKDEAIKDLKKTIEQNFPRKEKIKEEKTSEIRKLFKTSSENKPPGPFEYLKTGEKKKKNKKTKTDDPFHQYP